MDEIGDCSVYRENARNKKSICGRQKSQMVFFSSIITIDFYTYILLSHNIIRIRLLALGIRYLGANEFFARGDLLAMLGEAFAA